MKQVDTKKLVLGCLVIMILMIIYTKLDTRSNKIEEVTVSEVKDKKGVNSLLFPNSDQAEGSIYEETTDSSSSEKAEDEILGPAIKLDIESAKKNPYGVIVELDYVSTDRISMHGSFGYLSFSLSETEDGNFNANLESAVTLEELGGITMGGAAYTDIIGGDGYALIIPGIHNQEIARRRKFLYIEETNEIAGGIVAPQWMMDKMANHDYTDAIIENDYTNELAACVREQENSKLLYGPAVIPEMNTNTYGFLAEDGNNLNDVWYGLWNRDLGTIIRIPLF